jgi:hypothetical protein
MKPALIGILLSVALCFPAAYAQEASAGLDLRATVTAQGVASSLLTRSPRNGSPGAGGFRGVLYPTWKISGHWTATGALQLYTRPYFFADFSTAGYGAKGNVLQATVNYSRISDKGSLLLRVGQLSTSFGSFMLRYDDASNPLINMPAEYGYYYAPVSTLGVAGAQLDATRGKWDARAQFANSSPANPRSLFAHDQYGNWAGGAGYTIRQGLRVGVSGYHGPYLDRQYLYFFPGEANPSKLPATAMGVDVEWARGHWNVQGEAQKFRMTYTAIPDFKEQAGYGEVKRALGARWYVAGRIGYSSNSVTGRAQSFETAAAYRPNRFQLVKLEYELQHYDTGTRHEDNTLALQLVTLFHASAAAK